MAREHEDLINTARAEKSIEGALEAVLVTMAARWNAVAAANQHGKGAAMGNQLIVDMPDVVTAIMDHEEVFKPDPVIEEPRRSMLSGTPRKAVRSGADKQQSGESDDEYAFRMKDEKVEDVERKPRPQTSPSKRFAGESDADYKERTGQ